MNERKLDPLTGDIALAGGHVVRTSSFEESVLQTVKTFLSTFEGECFSDRNSGVPWFDKVLGAEIPFADYSRKIIEEKILTVPGVKRVVRTSMNFDGRKMSGKVTVVLDDGNQVNMEM